MLLVLLMYNVYAEDCADDTLAEIVELRFGKDFEAEFRSRY